MFIKMLLRNYYNTYQGYMELYNLMNTKEDCIEDSIKQMDPFWSGSPKESFNQFFQNEFGPGGHFYETNMLYKAAGDMMLQCYPDLVMLSY